MADTVDGLIKALSEILDRNRQQRAQVQTQQAAQSVAEPDAASGFNEGFSRAMKQQEQAKAMRNPESGYGGDRAVSPYNFKNSPGPSAASLSPSTTAAGRVKLGQDYARLQGLLNNNPYREAPYTPSSDPALEERKKRFTQDLMNRRGESGGPLGGAGQELNTPTTSSMDPSVVGAVSRPTQMVQMGQPAAYPTTEQPDYALLDAYQAYQKQRGGL